MGSTAGVPTSGVDRGRAVSRHILTVVMETAGNGFCRLVKSDHIIQRVHSS
jgi:hypothetical protein